MSRPATRHAEKIARLARRAGVLRPRDLDRHRIPRMALLPFPQLNVRRFQAGQLARAR